MRILDRLKIITPFSYMWILRHHIGNPKTILDLGCGDGSLMAVLSQWENWQITGVDIYANSLKRAKDRRIYQKLIKGDVLISVMSLTKSSKKYDVVFFSQVIEHIPKNKGEKVLNEIEKLAVNRVIVGTPKGFMEQPQEFLGGNPHQIHESGWNTEDFRSRGYKVFGIGFVPIWSEFGLARTKNKLLFTFYTLISYLLSPLIYFFPRLGAGLLCIKEIHEK